MKNPFITIELKTINKSILAIYTTFLKTIFLKLNISFKVISLPILKKKITLLRSPHVYKKSREQFEFTRYKQTINIYSNCNSYLLKYLIINKPSELKLVIKKNLNSTFKRK